MPSSVLYTSRPWPKPRLLQFFVRLATLRRQRNALAGLSDAALEDIGVTREEARIEARRPLWDVPNHWRR